MASATDDGKNAGPGATNGAIETGQRSGGGRGDALGGLATGQPISVNPADIGRDTATRDEPETGSGGTRRGGRRKGRAATPAAAPAYAGETAALDVNGIEKILVSVHMLLSGVLKAPGLILTEAEARQLAEATANVSRHYNVQATQKTIDWVNFGTCCVLIYGTRIMASSKRKKEEAAARAQTGGIILDFPGPIETVTENANPA